MATDADAHRASRFDHRLVASFPHYDWKWIAALAEGRALITGAEIIVLAAAGTFAASLGIAARLCGRSDVSVSNPKPVKKTSLRAAVAPQPEFRARVLRPEVIARHVVEELRFDGESGYPILKDDLDDMIRTWCAENEVALVPINVVRNLIAQQPGVKSKRKRLLEDSAENRFIRKRMEIRGLIQERPTVYVVSGRSSSSSDGVQDVAANVRTPDTTLPSSDQCVRTDAGSRPGPRPAASGRCPPTSSDDQNWSDVPRRKAA